jgi:thioredoxin-like negative regulator of GroEL
LDAGAFKDASFIKALGQFVPAKLDVDRAGKKPAAKFKVQFLPTMLVINSAGKVIATYEGDRSAKDLIKFLNAASAKAKAKPGK